MAKTFLLAISLEVQRTRRTRSADHWIHDVRLDCDKSHNRHTSGCDATAHADGAEHEAHLEDLQVG